MKIAIGADHAGVELKDHLRNRLTEAGHEVEDFGTHGSDSVDYPDFAAHVARAVAEGASHAGVLVCGSGIGISIAANRFAGVRCARCTSEWDARYARLHNDANVVAVGSRVTGISMAESIVDTFFATDFEGGRHARRVAKIDKVSASAPDSVRESRS